MNFLGMVVAVYVAYSIGRHVGELSAQVSQIEDRLGTVEDAVASVARGVIDSAELRSAGGAQATEQASS